MRGAATDSTSTKLSYGTHPQVVGVCNSVWAFSLFQAPDRGQMEGGIPPGLGGIKSTQGYENTRRGNCWFSFWALWPGDKFCKLE